MLNKVHRLMLNILSVLKQLNITKKKNHMYVVITLYYVDYKLINK